MNAPFSWAQLAAGRLPHSVPRPRTAPRSSSLRQVGREASATLPLDGATRGPRLPPLQLQHGMGALQPRQGFPCGQRCCDRKPATHPNGIAITTKDNRCKPVLSIPLPSSDQRHDEATSWASRPHTVIQSNAQVQRDPALETERILMVDFTPT
jgi:hypothetical protein